MDDNKKYVLDAKVERTIKALAKNRMAAVYAPTKEAAVQAVMHSRSFALRAEMAFPARFFVSSS